MDWMKSSCFRRQFFFFSDAFCTHIHTRTYTQAQVYYTLHVLFMYIMYMYMYIPAHHVIYILYYVATYTNVPIKNSNVADETVPETHQFCRGRFLFLQVRPTSKEGLQIRTCDPLLWRVEHWPLLSSLLSTHTLMASLWDAQTAVILWIIALHPDSPGPPGWTSAHIWSREWTLRTAGRHSPVPPWLYTS